MALGTSLKSYIFLVVVLKLFDLEHFCTLKKLLRTTESSFVLIYFALRHVGGEGSGNPLQYSCLEDPIDRGAWWAAVHGVAQSRTRLKWLSSSSSKACWILVPLPGIEPWVTCIGWQILNHWTTRENPAIDFELIFVKGVKSVSWLIFLHVNVQLFPDHLLKRLFASLHCFVSFKDQLT